VDNKKTITEMIRKSAVKAVADKGEYALFNGMTLYIQDQALEVDIKFVLSFIKRRIPLKHFYGIDAIFVGAFPELIDREVDAMFKDGAIYLTNEQQDEEDMIDDIVHEIAHSVEAQRPADIYADSEVEIEFLGKRKRLYNTLKQEYGNKITKIAKKFAQVEYDRDFDDFLYKVIGYPTLTSLTMGLFVSPYGVTSLREYFATAFAEYYIGDGKYVRTVSPSLYKKIITLEQED